MPSKSFVYPGTAPVALKLRAGYARVSISILKTGMPQASVTISGGPKLLDKITEHHGQRSWKFGIPNEDARGGIQISSSGGATIIGDAQDVSFSAGSIRVGSVRGGRGVHVSGGRAGKIVVNDVDVTGYVNEQRGQDAAEDEEVTFQASLPAGSSVELDVPEGSVQLNGDVAAQVKTYNANVTVLGLVTSGMIKTYNGQIKVSAAEGVSLESYNGNVHLSDARGQTMAKTYNGNVRIHATASVGIMANSYNGNVDVTASPGTSPQVMADTHNGRVTRP